MGKSKSVKSRYRDRISQKFGQENEVDGEQQAIAAENAAAINIIVQINILTDSQANVND